MRIQSDEILRFGTVLYYSGRIWYEWETNSNDLLHVHSNDMPLLWNGFLFCGCVSSGHKIELHLWQNIVQHYHNYEIDVFLPTPKKFALFNIDYCTLLYGIKIPRALFGCWHIMTGQDILVMTGVFYYISIFNNWR
jgi:hypothetical protein